MSLPKIIEEIIEEEGHKGLLWDDGVEVVYDKVVDTLRWSNINEAVVKCEDRFFMLSYQSPATEYQEGGDFDDYELEEVEPYEKTVVAYRKKK